MSNYHIQVYKEDREEARKYMRRQFAGQAMAGFIASPDLCAASVGSTQIRQRIYWMADADYPRWQGAERERQPDKTWLPWTTSRSQSMRSTGRYWPPGPREVGGIPVLADGLPGTMGRCRGFGNAIVPQLASQFIQAAREALNL